MKVVSLTWGHLYCRELENLHILPKMLYCNPPPLKRSPPPRLFFLSDFISRCTKIVKYYAPSWKVNPSYWAKFHFQMHCDSEILQNCSPLRNATPLIGPDFISRCTEIVKYYKIVSLKKGHTSYKVYFIIVEGWPYEGGTTVYSLNFIIMYSDKLLTWRTHQFIVVFSW